MAEYSLIHDSTELRKLIAENPDLPIVVLADEESASPDYSSTYCSSVHCFLGWLLDVKTPYDHPDGYVFSDKDGFENAIVEAFENGKQYEDLSNDEFFEAVKKEMEKYEDDWVQVIVIHASN